MFQSTNGGGMPNLRDAAKQNSLGLAAIASSMGMASSHEPAPCPCMVLILAASLSEV